MRRKKKQAIKFVGIAVLAILLFGALQTYGYVKKAQNEPNIDEKKATSYLSLPDVEEEKEKPQDATKDIADCDTVYVTYIDVAQGDATLIYDETTNYSVLIDTGLFEAYDNVQATLSEYGVNTLDALVLTHPDTDHIQSAVDVIKDYNVPVVYMSRAVNPEAKAYEYLTEYLKEQYSAGITYPDPGDEISLGGGSAKLIFLGPVEYKDITDTNGNSLVTRLENGEDAFLFMGDATGDEVDDILSLPLEVEADVLKASHHGSANDGCNSESLFKAADPMYLVVSCAYQNDHGHPHIETMELAKKYNLLLYRTDLQGSVSCKSTGSGIAWSKEPSSVYTNGNGF